MNWKEELKKRVKENKASLQLLCTLTQEELEVEFKNYFGSNNGQQFTAWTPTFVYFSSEYEGFMSVCSMPRNPPKSSTKICIYEKIMTKLEALKETLHIWKQINKENLTQKPNTKYLHNCPCCHYVVEEIFSPSHIKKFEEKDIVFGMLQEDNKLDGGLSAYRLP